jgi:penicillin-binding protein 2
LARAIQESCNAYFCRAAHMTGGEALAFWAREMGLGRQTGVDLPWEKAGRFPDAEWARNAGRPWSTGNVLNAGIGQGDVQITPMQAAVMMAAVANGGKVLRPSMLRMDTAEAARVTPVRVVEIDPSHLAAIHQGMRATVTRGSARHVKGLAELEVAAKTGTAETANAQINYGWLAGFAPWRTPKYAFAVAIHRTPLHGAEAAGPVVCAMLEGMAEAK